jgi:hypothetical protein
LASDDNLLNRLSEEFPRNPKWPDRFKKLNPIKVGSRIAGEAPPYPSCVGKD